MEATKTQHQKIIDMCSDGNWHCQNSFRALYIFSPHKRRSEITDGKAKGIPFGQYFFIDKPCEHGVRGQKDYKMMTRQQTLLSEPYIDRAEKIIDQATLFSDQEF